MREPHSTITQNKLVSVNRRREIKFLAEVNFINKELALKKSTKELKEKNHIFCHTKSPTSAQKVFTDRWLFIENQTLSRVGRGNPSKDP